MGYEIHIERDPPLTLQEWQSAVQTTEGVRLNPSGSSATNPRTGEVISIGGGEGDSQLRVEGEWLSCFRWRPSGSVVFKAGNRFTDPSSPVRQAARELARKLGAKGVGDEGEEYV